MATDPPIGTRIKRARERKRLSQQELADALGVSRSAVNAWETGRAYPRSAIGAIEEVLGIDLSSAPEPDPGSDTEAAERLEQLAAEMLDAARRMRAAQRRQRPPNGKANGDETRRAG